MPANPFLGANIDSTYGAFAAMYHYLISRGQAWFVDSTSGADSNSGQSPLAPFATLQKAFDMAATNNDDHIFLAPLHAEFIASAGAITLSKNGIRVFGLGQGSRMPTFTWSNTAGTFLVSGEGNILDNLRCTCSVDEIVKLWSVTGLNNELSRVNYFETATKQAIQFLLASSAAHDFTLRGCRHHQATAAGSAQKWIELAGCNRALVEKNAFFLTLNNAAGSVTISVSSASLNSEIAWNVISQLGGTTQTSGILVVDSSTGTFVHDNRVAVGSTALPGIVTVGTGGYAAENYALNTANKSGLLDPVADS